MQGGFLQSRTLEEAPEGTCRPISSSKFMIITYFPSASKSRLVPTTCIFSASSRLTRLVFGIKSRVVASAMS